MLLCLLFINKHQERSQVNVVLSFFDKTVGRDREPIMRGFGRGEAAFVPVFNSRLEHRGRKFRRRRSLAV